jgi:hypothetical protein
MNHITHVTRQSSWMTGRWLLGLLGSLVLGSLPGGTADARGSAPVEIPGQITFQDGQLTARFGGASLWQVMAEVARLSGVQVRWMDTAVKERALSVEFYNLTLAEGVRRMLRAHNVLLVYTPSGEGTRLTQIWIASREDGGLPGRDRPSAPPVLPPPTIEEPAATMEQSMAGTEPPLEALIQIATEEADLAARLNAIGALGNHAPHDARIREFLEDLADHDSHPQVRDTASMLLGGGR